MTALTPSQYLGVEIATRTSSVISLLGSLFIITTYLFLPYFRRPTTRLIFYATWGNVLTNVATLVSVSAIPGDGALCQLQAFLIQWCMLADPFWVFCMAVNVGLIFKVKRFDGSKIPNYELWYCLVAYGVPAVVPVIYLVHDQVSSQRLTGPAILWCWVRKEFDWMRIAFFYAPMWVLAIMTMSIHVWVGCKIYKAKMEMRKCRKASQQRFTHMAPGTLEDPFVDPDDAITVTTKISHNIHGLDWSRSTTPFNDINWLARSPPRTSPTIAPGLLVPLNPHSPVRHHNPLLISKYRATAYAAPLASGDFATLPSPQVPVFQPREHLAHTQRRKETGEAFRYFKSALLLFVALVVVWVPSSANRLYQLARPEAPSYALNLISAIVLPTQGFWNAVIYAHAAGNECRRAWAGGRVWVSGRAGEGKQDEAGGKKGSVATEMSAVHVGEVNESKLPV